MSPFLTLSRPTSTFVDFTLSVSVEISTNPRLVLSGFEQMGHEHHIKGDDKYFSFIPSSLESKMWIIWKSGIKQVQGSDWFPP